MVLARKLHTQNTVSAPSHSSAAVVSAKCCLFARKSTRALLRRKLLSVSIVVAPRRRSPPFYSSSSFFSLLFTRQKFLTSGKGFFTTSFGPFFHRNGFSFSGTTERRNQKLKRKPVFRAGKLNKKLKKKSCTAADG